MSFEGPGEMAIINSIINIHVYIEILDNFLIPTIENWFGNNEVIFQDDLFIEKKRDYRHVKSMT